MRLFIGMFVVLLSANVSFGQAKITLDPFQFVPQGFPITPIPAKPTGKPQKLLVSGKITYPEKTEGDFEVEVIITEKINPKQISSQKKTVKNSGRGQSNYYFNRFPLKVGIKIDIEIIVTDSKGKIVDSVKKKDVEVVEVVAELNPCGGSCVAEGVSIEKHAIDQDMTDSFIDYFDLMIRLSVLAR